MDVTVNGRAVPLEGADGSLLRFLRESLGLKGAKPGCGEGACGACTVLVEGRPVRACVTPAHAVSGASVLTVEGLAAGGLLHPVQEAFVEVGAFQCGYCTPGMVMSAVALLRRSSRPSKAVISAALEGNVCRCCAYPRIVRAVRRASELAGPGRAVPGLAQSELPRPKRPWSSVEPEERDYFDVLGEGLVVVARRPESADWTTCDEAWLHLGANGSATAFTGKVDVGQGTVDALAALVAEELERPVESVRVVCGDTDVCPYDLGTFGSRSTPDVAPLLTAAAEGARRSLDESGGLSARRVEVVAAVATPKSPGGPVGRRAATAIVIGAQVYPSDIDRPGSITVRPVQDAESRPEPAEDQLAEYLRSHPAEPEGWEGTGEESVGDVERALADAPLRLDATYTTSFLAHAPLETRAAVAEWHGDALTVWTGTQRPFGVREQLAEALGLEEEQIRVIAPVAGGGFGGKHTADAALEAARLAREQGRPVRVHWTREDEFRLGYVRPAAIIDVRAGALDDGTLVAWDFLDVNAGAAGLSVPYRVDDWRIRFQPAESPLPQGSYRALAATANNFARESHLDELAGLAGADPLELRLRILDDERLRSVLEAAAERAGWNEREGRSLGIAAGLEKGAYVATCVEVSGGTVARIVTAFDCGAVLDPDNLANQIEGATVMGLGAALFERVRFEGSTIRNASLTAYRVPRFGDVPPIEVVLLDRPAEPSAGAGEAPIVAVSPAVAAALHAETGERLRALPLLRA